MSNTDRQSHAHSNAWEQFAFLRVDLRRMVNKRPLRWAMLWSSPAAWTILRYRFDRFGFLLTGRAWAAVRLVFYPLFLLMRILGSSAEINYKADIAAGLSLLHPTLGCVVSGYVRAGRYLTLVGGNCIGGRAALKDGDLTLGSHVTLGANAVILGPAQIGDNVVIGAGAVLVGNAASGSHLVGIPARPTSTSTAHSSRELIDL